MEQGEGAAVLQRITGGIVQQSNLKHTGQHQRFVLVEAEQLMSVNLGRLHTLS